MSKQKIIRRFSQTVVFAGFLSAATLTQATSADLGNTHIHGVAAPNALPNAENTVKERTELLLTLIVTWLARNFDLPAHYDHPNIQPLPEETLKIMRYGPDGTEGQRDIVALYHDGQETVYLAENWSGRSPAGLSVLVHEMVHHLQNRGDHVFSCPAEREKTAYAAQEKWLGLFGQSLISEYEIDPLTLKVSTVCML